MKQTIPMIEVRAVYRGQTLGKRAGLCHAAAFISGFLLIGAGPSSEVPKPDRGAIRAVLKSWWESIETLEFHCIEGQPTGERKIDRTGNGLVYEFAQASGGRRDFVVKQAGPGGGSKLVENQKDDGSKSYIVHPFPGHPGSISRLSILNQESGRDDYQGTTFSVLWLIMPGGKPVWRRIEDGASLINRRGASGTEEVALTFTHRGIKVECILDRGHDWLPRDVSLESDPPIYWKASDFTREKGHWFPVAGTLRTPSINKRTEEMAFVVQDLRINHSIHASRFDAPKIADGVIVTDSTSPKLNRIHSSNPRISREELIALRQRYQASFAQKDGSTPPPSTPLRAPRDSGAFPWSSTFAVGSTCLIGLSAVLLYRSRHGHSG